MAIYGYTKNYKLIKPQFDTDTWHDYVYDNLDTIDAVLSAIFASGDWQGFWKSNTHYDVGGVVIDRATDTMYKVMVEHTTSEATFAEEFAAHPTYYELWSPNNLAEDWAIKMDGVVSNVDYSSKAYAISSGLIDAGSAKEWAVGSGTIGDTGEYSAKKYATDAHNDYISMTTDANVVAVGTNIANVNTVSSNISDVNTTATNISSVNTVAGDISRVGLVADDISSVHTVAIDISNVIDVAANKTNIDTVAGISTDVTTVASIATAVSNVSGIESEVLDVSDNRTDISTVASNISDVNTVAGISTDVSTVATNDTNVTTVATNISDVNTTATNIAAIQAAPTAASNAAASATLAQNWATKMDGQVASTDYSSKYYAGQAAASSNNANIWAEGTDAQVQALGGVHSSKVWAEQSTNANIALTNSPYTTNRILEIPQDIKLELNNGTLTLKAGSKVYVPNGFEQDGVTQKFDVVTTTEDVIQTNVSSTARLMFLKNSAEFGTSLPVSNCFSGNTSPTHTGYAYWYDTANNIIRYDGNTGTWDAGGYSLPVGIRTADGSVVTSIDQVFNGFGYIGSTVFMLPGVKSQVSWGRNADGTFYHEECISKKVLTLTRSSGALSNWILWSDCWNGEIQNLYYYRGFERVKSLPASSTTYTKIFNEEDGYYYHTDSGTTLIKSTVGGLPVVSNISCDADGRVTSFTPCDVNTVNTYSRSELSNMSAPSTKYENWTILASESQYIAPANGIVSVTQTNSSNGYCNLYVNNGDGSMGYIASGYSGKVSIRVRRGQTIIYAYTGRNASSINNSMKFIYDQGEV